MDLLLKKININRVNNIDMVSYFGINGVTPNNLIAFGIIGLIMYIFIFHVMDNFPERIQKYVDKIQYICFYNCDTDTCKKISNLRDNTYFISDRHDIDIKKCMITSWEISHLIFHIFIGYYLNFYCSFVTGVAFEIFEHYKYDCGSYLDIFWNTLGYSIGYGIRSL